MRATVRYACLDGVPRLVVDKSQYRDWFDSSVSESVEEGQNLAGGANDKYGLGTLVLQYPHFPNYGSRSGRLLPRNAERVGPTPDLYRGGAVSDASGGYVVA